MSQRYDDNTKRPKPKKKVQLGILKIYAFYWKIQQRALGPGESTAGITTAVRIHQKSCGIFPLKVRATLLNGSKKGAVRG